MTTSIDQHIPDIRRALFDGDFAHASKVVDGLRICDPHLEQLAKSFLKNDFGLFSFQSFVMDREYNKQERLKRQKLVLSWFDLPEQIKIMQRTMTDLEDVCDEIIDCMKLQQLNTTTCSRLTTLLSEWLGYQKISEVKKVMQISGIAITDVCDNSLFVFSRTESRGAVRVTRGVHKFPMYAVVAFNYTPELLDFVVSQGATLQDVSQMCTVVENMPINFGGYLNTLWEEYKATSFQELQSRIEHFNISSVVNTDGCTSASKSKKM